MTSVSADATSTEPLRERDSLRAGDDEERLGGRARTDGPEADSADSGARRGWREWAHLDRQQVTALAGAAAAVTLMHLAIGLRPEHWVSAGAFAVLVLLGGRALRLALLMMPIPLVLVLYDLSRYTAQLRGEVHVADLYFAELRWFGVGQGADRQLLTDLLAQHTHAALDFICGLAYLVYLYVPILLAVLLFRRHGRTMAVHSWAFLLVNVMGFVTYVVYPAAPPWYAAQYGLGPAQLDVLPDAAGAARFDSLLGIDYFANFYARSANVFGAMPSLHVAYPTVGFVSVAALGWRWAVPTAAFALLVAFSAVYLQHHYVWDVLAGALFAVVAWAVVRAASRRVRLPGLEPGTG